MSKRACAYYKVLDFKRRSYSQQLGECTIIAYILYLHILLNESMFNDFVCSLMLKLLTSILFS